MNIDLKELIKRESERIEWKDQVASVESVVKTIVAFCNDYSNLGGGYVICGAKEIRDEHGFPAVEYTGLISSRYQEIEKKTIAHCKDKVSPPVTFLTEVLPCPSDEVKKILILIVPSTGAAHSYRPSSKEASTYYIRSGSNTIEAKNGLLMELLVRKKQLEPWDKRTNVKTDLSNIDLIAFRDSIQEMKLWDQRKSLEEYFSPENKLSDFVPPLAGKVGIDNRVCMRNFAILMFGKNPLNYFDGAYSIFSIYHGTDRGEPTAERSEIKGTIVQQARKLIELLNAESTIAFDKTSENPNQIKYPKRALQEAVINGLVHRDYESNQPLRVTVFSDRIEINSPGKLPSAIEIEKFKNGKAHSHWRNQSLAYFFSKLQLAQAEGQGIPTIIRTMKEEGNPNPVFEVSESNVICIIPAHPRHKKLKDVFDIENKIVIGNHLEAYEKTRQILLLDKYNFRAIELFCEINNLLGTQSRVFAFLKSSNIDLQLLNPNLLITIAEALSLIENKKSYHKDMIQEVIALSRKSQLEEKQILRIVLSLKKIQQNESLVEYIDERLKENISLNTSSPLLEERARAKMNLAKNCIKTGNSKTSVKIKKRAWDRCRILLAEAEIDLKTALQNTTLDIERDYIKKDMIFLEKMKVISTKPTKR